MDGWIPGSEVCPSADDCVGSVVHDDGTIGGEGTGTRLFEERFVCLSYISWLMVEVDMEAERKRRCDQ